MNIVPIPTFPGYGVTEDGRVWSCKRGEYKEIQQTIATHKPNAQGYYKVTISTAFGRGNRVYKKVHTLVALAFIGPKQDGMQVNHKDGDTFNNAASNLEYVTQGENSVHAYLHGLKAKPQGELHPGARLTEADVLEIRTLRKDKAASVASIAERFKISRAHVKSITSRKRWGHI